MDMTGSLLATGDTECGISCPAMSRGGDREAGPRRRKGGGKKGEREEEPVPAAK